MPEKEAIEIFNRWMDCRDAFHADEQCDMRCEGCEHNVRVEEMDRAVITAISALKKQEQSCETCKHGRFGDEACINCRVGFPNHYEAEEES